MIGLEFQGITLVDPWFLLGLPAIALLLGLRLLRRRAALPAASAAPFRGLPVTLRQRCVHLPLLCLGLGAMSWCVALARPVHREPLPLREEGVDILLVVDTSSSMLLNDMDEKGKLRRVDAARQRAQEFAAARHGDRVGLVTFARYAELRCPPTLDEQALGAFVRVIDTVPTNSELDGTAIGTALAKATQVLDGSKAKSRVVVLLSDGENTVPGADGEGGIQPEDAVKLAVDAGLRVHTIGLGTGVPDPFGRMRPLTFAALRLAAERTGGRFFPARSDRDLGEVYAAIDELEKAPIEEPRYRTTDRFEPPLLLGVAFLLLGLLLDLAWVRAVP